MPLVDLRELAERIDDVDAPFPQRAAKLMTYEAALHLMTGRSFEKLAPERNMAELLYTPFKKRHPDPVQGPEEPEQPKEEIKQEEIREAGNGGLVV